ncbi:biotin-dependent carboxyltransferase family protein [Luteimonas vadosa]|uniref:5-oxoprolinase subunit PxpC n=1 Tax=Luteimonas vadosa TaxID=1165507 RepID=A0ABP9E5V5_9GAMM
MSVHVLAPGLLSTLQDGGRRGWRHLGVGSAGALDRFSHIVANRLVGNPDDEVVIEMSLQGPRLRFDRSARIAFCGGDFAADVDGTDVAGWRRVDVPAGATLSFGACRRGARAWLAVAGGFAVPRVLGSASTDLRGGFGGMRGRALAKGDVLPVAACAQSMDKGLAIAPWWIDPTPDLALDQRAVVRVLPGRDALDPGDALFAQPWRVDPASNRQGLRLEGKGLRLQCPREAVSEPVAPGTIQLPPDGGPIVLLADAQTHGGYPRIGHAIRADWPRLAQLRPGDAVHFEACTAEDATRLACEQRQRLARIGYAISARSAAR